MTHQRTGAENICFTLRDGVDVDFLQVAIDTARLRLRVIEHGDLEIIFKEFTDSITRFMAPTAPQRIEETATFLASALSTTARGENLQLVITRKETGEFLGCCGLHLRDSACCPELGIWLKAGAHGHAFGREAIQALKEWAERFILYDYLIYPVDRNNMPSRKIPESLGGVIFKECLVTKANGCVLDEVVYRINPSARQPQ